MSFPGQEEADLVCALRASGDAIISLVATGNDKIVGHIMLSRMKAPFKALGLAPLSVLADWRKQGIAANLVQNAIEVATTEGWRAIFVLGDPRYYRRFGFSVSNASGFQSIYAGPYFMVLSLQKEQLSIKTGVIEYAPPFSQLT